MDRGTAVSWTFWITGLGIPDGEGSFTVPQVRDPAWGRMRSLRLWGEDEDVLGHATRQSLIINGLYIDSE